MEANEKLEKQVAYYKKENVHSQSYTVLPKSSSAQKNRVDDYSNSAIYISEPSTTEGKLFVSKSILIALYVTPGKHTKNSKSNAYL